MLFIFFLSYLYIYFWNNLHSSLQNYNNKKLSKKFMFQLVNIFHTIRRQDHVTLFIFSKSSIGDIELIFIDNINRILVVILLHL